MAYEATLSLFSLSPFARSIHGDLDQDLPALEKRLRKAARRSGPIAIGSATEPYEPVGSAAARSLLLACTRVEGLELSITTRSPLIAGDLSLLTELDRRHAVTVHLLMTSADDELLGAVEALAAEGIDTRVVCLPGPQADEAADEAEDEAALRWLFAQAREAGASDVSLQVAARRKEGDPLVTTFRRLRLEHGFPRSVPGRG